MDSMILTVRAFAVLLVWLVSLNKKNNPEPKLAKIRKITAIMIDLVRFIKFSFNFH